jgi:hypothetical protein
VLHPDDVVRDVVQGDERRHDEKATQRDGEQRDAGPYGLVFLEPADLVDDRLVPVEEVDPERDECEPQYAERLPLLVLRPSMVTSSATVCSLPLRRGGV